MAEKRETMKPRQLKNFGLDILKIDKIPPLFPYRPRPPYCSLLTIGKILHQVLVHAKSHNVNKTEALSFDLTAPKTIKEAKEFNLILDRLDLSFFWYARKLVQQFKLGDDVEVVLRRRKKTVYLVPKGQRVKNGQENCHLS